MAGQNFSFYVPDDEDAATLRALVAAEKLSPSPRFANLSQFVVYSIRLVNGEQQGQSVVDSLREIKTMLEGISAGSFVVGDVEDDLAEHMSIVNKFLG